MSTLEKVSPHNLPCIEAAVAIFGDKWTPLLVNELARQPSLRFCQLQDLTGNINPRTLSARLSSLETEGIVQKVIYSTIPPRTEYSLTKKGLALVPVLEAMATWSECYAKKAPL